MLESILSLYKINKLDKIKNDKEALREELSRIRFMYNFCCCFSSGFVLTFFGGGFFGGGVTGFIFKVEMNSYAFYIMAIGMIALFIHWIIAFAKCICYEEMKFVEDELEKINSTIQPNPKKMSVRIYNRNLVRRSNFGR